MKIYSETPLRNFEFWAGAKDRVEHLYLEELDEIENVLEELYPDGTTETMINDLFWFEEDWIADILGYNSFDEIMERDDEEA